MSFNPGEQVGPYRIIEQLGQGGMATVFKAYHAALDRFVALKVLHPAFLEDKNFHARFSREAKLVAKLDHPNIVPIYDYAEHEGRPFLVMKYIEGITLKARISNGSAGNEETLRIVECIGDALTYAHKRGILHRDVKPSNVILASDGQIYLADFGLARIAQSGESTLTNDMVIGTPQYISPEQALGKKDLDEGTDIYSFGVMIYEMTVGRVPFSADTPFSIIHDHIYSPLPLPSVVNPAISPDLERVLLKALAKDRADRYPDVSMLVAAFKQAWLGQTATAKTVQSVYPDALTIAPMPRNPAEVVSPDGKQDQNGGEVGLQPSTKKRKISRWVWIVLVLFLCTFCGLLVLASGSKERKIANAQHTLEYDPGNPQAHLNLGMTYAQANMPRLAMDQINKSAEMGAKDNQFLSKAADELTRGQYWVPAVLMYLKLGELVGMNGMVPAQKDSFHEAVYKAAAGSDYQFFDIIPLDQLQQVDSTLALIAQARYYSSKGDETKARKFADAIQKVDPSDPELLLSKAEQSTKMKNYADARTNLKELIDNPSTPEWVKRDAREMLKNLPQ